MTACAQSDPRLAAAGPKQPATGLRVDPDDGATLELDELVPLAALEALAPSLLGSDERAPTQAPIPTPLISAALVCLTTTAALYVGLGFVMDRDRAAHVGRIASARSWVPLPPERLIERIALTPQTGRGRKTTRSARRTRPAQPRTAHRRRTPRAPQSTRHAEPRPTATDVAAADAGVHTVRYTDACEFEPSCVGAGGRP